MAKQFRTNNSTINSRDHLFQSAKRSLNKASRTVNEDELAELLETIQQIAASLKARTAKRQEDDEDEVEEIDNEDDEEETDEKTVVKAMRANSREDSVQRALAKDARYVGQRGGRHVENERKSSGNSIINAMSEYRDTDAVVRELRRKGR